MPFFCWCRLFFVLFFFSLSWYILIDFPALFFRCFVYLCRYQTGQYGVDDCSDFVSDAFLSRCLTQYKKFLSLHALHPALHDTLGPTHPVDLMWYVCVLWCVWCGRGWSVSISVKRVSVTLFVCFFFYFTHFSHPLLQQAHTHDVPSAVLPWLLSRVGYCYAPRPLAAWKVACCLLSNFFRSQCFQSVSFVSSCSLSPLSFSSLLSLVSLSPLPLCIVHSIVSLLCAFRFSNTEQRTYLAEFAEVWHEVHHEEQWVWCWWHLWIFYFIFFQKYLCL